MRALVIASVLLCAPIVETATTSRCAVAAPDAGARVRKRLARGRKLFDDQEYRRAIRTLAPIRKDAAATRAQRLHALEVIGLSYLILGQDKRAAEAFEDLLAIDPGYQLRDDTGSPKIRTFFDKVKRDYVPGFDAEAVVELEHAAPPSAVGGRRIEIEVRVSGRDADNVKQIVLTHRRRGALAWSDRVPLRRLATGTWRARFKAPAAVRGFTLEYYIEARGIAGGVVGRVGGPETPLALPVTAGGGAGPWYRRWYTIAGGAALVGIGAALLITSGDDAKDGSLDPGRIILTP